MRAAGAMSGCFRVFALPTLLEDNAGKCCEKWGSMARAEKFLVPVVSELECRKRALTSKLGRVPFN